MSRGLRENGDEVFSVLPSRRGGGGARVGVALH